MGGPNRVVELVLQSPLHRMLSGNTDLVRYIGPRSGRVITTPTQYAPVGGELDDGIVILVGNADRKSWWRNFRGGRNLHVLLRGRWVPMSGTAVVGADDPLAAAPLIAAYVKRFPQAARAMGASPEERLRRAVLVKCTPRAS